MSTDASPRMAAGHAPGATATRGTIVLAVTISDSIGLLRGYQAHLVARGWQVHVVSSPGPEMDALVGSADGVTYHPLPMERQPSPLRDLRALASWVRLLRQLRPDVVSAGTPKAGMLGMLAARITRVPRRIYHQRGLRLEAEQGMRRRVLRATERLTVRCATHVLAVSHSLARVLERERLAPAAKITVLGSGSSAGVDLARFADHIAEHPHTGRVVGFVGRITPAKGLDALARAVAMLHERGVDATLLVVGGVEDPAAARPLRRLAERGVRIESTGHVPDPAALYRRMTVLCLPTKREGFPNVVLEAATCGIPAVTTRATGAVDSVVDGETGLLVPVDDAGALADALERVLLDPELAATLGRAARRRVEERFDRRLLWPLLDEFHDAMLEERG